MIEAGRELDRLVGERVMGYTVRQNDVIYGTVFLGLYALNGKQVYYSIHEEQGTTVTCTTEDQAWAKCCPPFSTDLETAWTVVQRMRRHKQYRNLQLIAYAYNRTYATFTPGAFETDDWCEANGVDATPTAICLAALEACPEGADVWLPDVREATE